MIPERYLNFLSEISGKFPIGNFGKLPRPIPMRSGTSKENSARETLKFYEKLKNREIIDHTSRRRLMKLGHLALRGAGGGGVKMA